MMSSEKAEGILRLVMDESILRRLAWHKWTGRERIPEELFLYLAGSWVVHSELGLDHDISMTSDALREALEEGGIPFEKEDGGFRLSLEHLPTHVSIGSDGLTAITVPFGGTAVSLTGPSIVRLLRFVDSVLPQAERMVMDRALRIERDELASTFAARVLREKLESLGILHRISEYSDHLKVEVLLPPDGKLTFSFKPEEVDRVAGHIGEAVSAAQTLHNLHLDGLFFRPLERWDHWADPFNRKV